MKGAPVIDSPWQTLMRPGEKIIWEGRPLPGFHQPGKSLFLMIFGLPFLVIGVALFVFGLHRLTQVDTASDAGLALFLTAFALPFGALGGFLVFGPYVSARNAARRVRYALSNRAAYVERTTLGRKFEVYPILPMTALEIEEGKKVSSIWVHARMERDSDGDMGTVRAGFENIADGQSVYQLIRQIQAETK